MKRPVSQFTIAGRPRNSHDRSATFVPLLAGILIIAFILSACASPQPITRVVHITRHEYVPVPPSLLAPCPKADVSQIVTNGDLLDAFLRDQAALDTCNGQLDAIKTLAPPPAT